MKKPRHKEKSIAYLANLNWNPAASLQNPQPPLLNTHDAIYFFKNSKYVEIRLLNIFWRSGSELSVEKKFGW